MSTYKLKIDLPCLVKGATYEFDHETSNIYRIEKNHQTNYQYPLRPGLAGYLWMLLQDEKRKKYLRKIW